MKKRGFTLIEVVIVLSLTTILSAGIVALLRGMLRESAQLRDQGDRLQETRRAALRIFNAARQGAKIEPDQRGLRLKDGRQIVWKDGLLRLGGHPVIQESLKDFLVVRRDGRLHLVFELPKARYEFDEPEQAAL